MELSEHDMAVMSHQVLKQLVAESGLKFGPTLTQKSRNLAKTLGIRRSEMAQFVKQLIEELTDDALHPLFKED